MDNTVSDQFEIGDMFQSYGEKRFSPLKQEEIKSNRGSSFDIEECMSNMNSMSNVNPRFAVAIETNYLNSSRY
jgi:hypothetical protein